MRPRNRGFGIVEVLIAAALLAIVMGGFLQFMKSANKAQSNLTKVAESNSMDVGIRSILSNATGCRNTMTGINMGTVGTPPTTYHAVGTGAQAMAIRSPFNQVMYQAGTVVNGLRITGIEAYVGAPTNGVYFVQVHVRTDKEGGTTGERMGRIDYDYKYFLNVIAPGGVIDRCFSTPSDVSGTQTLLATERVQLDPAAGFGYAVVIGRPGGPYPWGGAPVHYNYEYYGAIDPNCAPHAAPLCPRVAGPLTAPILARGNRLVFSFNVQLGLVAVGTGVYAFGGMVFTELLTNGGTLVSRNGIANMSSGAIAGGEFSGANHSGETVSVVVTPGTYYRFRMVTTLGGESTGGTTPFAVSASRAGGLVYHYLAVP